MKKIKLLFIECNRLFRENLGNRLMSEEDLEITSLSNVKEEILKIAEETKPDVILLDQRAFRDNNFHLLVLLQNRLANPKFVLMDVDPYDGHILDFLRWGVTGIVLRDASLDVLLKTIRNASEGFRILPPGLPQTPKTQVTDGLLRGDESGGIASKELTRRESQVAELIGAGLVNKEIASQLNISTFTVKSHVRSILSKLRVKTRLQVAVFVGNRRDQRSKSKSSPSV